jgi:hypothetical protein
MWKNWDGARTIVRMIAHMIACLLFTIAGLGYLICDLYNREVTTSSVCGYLCFIAVSILDATNEIVDAIKGGNHGD